MSAQTPLSWRVFTVNPPFAGADWPVWIAALWQILLARLHAPEKAICKNPDIP
jgi:hypothetical protein